MRCSSEKEAGAKGFGSEPPYPRWSVPDGRAGMYCTDKEPGYFGTLVKVLINNYWPRVGDPEVTDLGTARTAMATRRINAPRVANLLEKVIRFRCLDSRNYVQKW